MLGDWAPGSRARCPQILVTLDDTGQMVGATLVVEVYGPVSGQLLGVKQFPWIPSSPDEVGTVQQLCGEVIAAIRQQEGLLPYTALSLSASGSSTSSGAAAFS